MGSLRNKVSKWPEDPLRKPLRRIWKLLLRQTEQIIEWSFFYKPKDKMDKVFHVFEVLAVLTIIWALLRR